MCCLCWHTDRVPAPNDTVYAFNSTDGKGLDSWLAGTAFFEIFHAGGHLHRWTQFWETSRAGSIYERRECLCILCVHNQPGVPMNTKCVVPRIFFTLFTFSRPLIKLPIVL